MGYLSLPDTHSTTQPELESRFYFRICTKDTKEENRKVLQIHKKLRDEAEHYLEPESKHLIGIAYFRQGKICTFRKIDYFREINFFFEKSTSFGKSTFFGILTYFEKWTYSGYRQVYVQILDSKTLLIRKSPTEKRKFSSLFLIIPKRIPSTNNSKLFWIMS